MRIDAPASMAPCLDQPPAPSEPTCGKAPGDAAEPWVGARVPPRLDGPACGRGLSRRFFLRQKSFILSPLDIYHPGIYTLFIGKLGNAAAAVFLCKHQKRKRRETKWGTIIS